MSTLDDLLGPRRSHHVWGDLDVEPTRYGHTRVRIRVLPPHITPAQLTMWRALHAWPVAGLAAGVGTTLALLPLVAANVAIGLGAAVWLGPLVVLWALAQGTIRATVERWYVLQADGDPTVPCARALSSVRDLCDAEAQDAARLEEAWRRVYADLAATSAVPPHPRPARS